MLTVLTQIGGIIYIISLLFFRENTSKYNIKRLVFFFVFYGFTTFLIVPNITPLLGRVKIDDNQNLKAHHIFTKICNRNYTTVQMKTVLQEVSTKLKVEFKNIKLIYLDANFPFFDGFPLLPHLSHNDGKKIDLSFIYEDTNGHLTNLKPANSGYGVFEEPLQNELHQTNICKQKGYWQYDFTKYITFGANINLKLSTKATKRLIEILSENKAVHKIFIEPHLKSRFQVQSSKIRFHGCKAVRHDDHIHFQIL
ncbi:hypothetical protein [Polaribacter sp. R77954]|uniref:hypothetical protein n=1 Tax=Polaribacter sp. R77954 TaxID=3093870 RepID=UPI0037C8C125